MSRRLRQNLLLQFLGGILAPGGFRPRIFRIAPPTTQRTPAQPNKHTRRTGKSALALQRIKYLIDYHTFQCNLLVPTEIVKFLPYFLAILYIFCGHTKNLAKKGLVHTASQIDGETRRAGRVFLRGSRGWIGRVNYLSIQRLFEIPTCGSAIDEKLWETPQKEHMGGSRQNSLTLDFSPKTPFLCTTDSMTVSSCGSLATACASSFQHAFIGNYAVFQWSDVSLTSTICSDCGNMKGEIWVATVSGKM